MRRLTSWIGVAFALAAQPAIAASSIFDFGLGFSEASITHDGKTFRIYTNKRGKDSLMLQPAVAELAANPGRWPITDWRTAAEAFVAPVGCGISDVQALTKSGGTWEALYVCPPSVDLKALIKAQSQELQRGAPLHL